MNIKKMPESERPQEKMLYAGAGCLSNSELLALIIRTGTGRKSAVRLADEVISYANDNIGDLGLAEVRELTEIDGIGEAKACSIVAAMELSKRLIADRQGSVKVRIRDSRQVAEILTEEMMGEKRELFMALNLNSKLQIESKSVISIGNLDSAPVHPREVFGPAIRRGAAAVVVAHNHPSGDPTPSAQDIDVTKRLIKASEILGIRLLDHVIVGNGCFTSMKSEGYFTD
ncbi:MAG: JAB domain-containing protein [Clostridiales bacterium]|nr:JAB domain-containing protein [Clostridiales bacterium]